MLLKLRLEEENKREPKKEGRGWKKEEDEADWKCRGPPESVPGCVEVGLEYNKKENLIT